MAESAAPVICETLRITLDNLLRENNLRIHEVPKDGFCLIQACADALRIQRSELINKLEVELTDSSYQSYFTAGCNISLELDKYLKHGIYNSDLCDVCIPAIANVTGLTVIVYQIIKSDHILKTVHTQNRCSLSKQPVTLQLLRSGSDTVPGLPLHYDALMPRMPIICNERHIPAALMTKSRKRECFKQMSIGSMFKKRSKESFDKASEPATSSSQVASWCTGIL